MTKFMNRMLGAGAFAVLPAFAPAVAQTAIVAEFETTVAVEHDVAFFYDELAPHGHWIDLPPYGWVWQPAHVSHHWRPYTVGHWVLTDEYGWLWVSDLEWGWAPFHYGRWTYEHHFGWVWVPGTEWGPAWVAWRASDEHIGWAPLPPQAEWHADAGLRWGGGGVDVTGTIHPEHWSFVEERSFLSPHLHQHCLEPTRNVVILRRTKDATRYVHRNGRVINVSVPVARIERRVGRRIARRSLRLAGDDAHRKTRVDDNAITLFRPTLAKRPPGKAPTRVIRAKSPAGPRHYGSGVHGPSIHDPQRDGSVHAERVRRSSEGGRRHAREPKRASQEQERSRGHGGSPEGNKSKKRRD